MKTAKYVGDLINDLKTKDKPLQEIAWQAALACVGWSYVFGARGEECNPPNRRAKASDKYPTIKSRCCNFNGSKDVVGDCVKCKWYPGGRTRFFDCRGFTYWILKAVYGFILQGVGATSQWNTESNWAKKGLVSDGLPKDTLVCLFVHDGKKTMEHTGFGFNEETVECGSGVQHFNSRNKKWTHWAVPKCVMENSDNTTIEEPKSTGSVTVTYPTIRQGAKGDVVTQLQMFLSKLGSSLQIDGIFGVGTATAVRAFQKKYGLVVDGIVGPKTWGKLLEVAGNIKPSEPVKEEKVSLLIPDISKAEADELKKKYPRAEVITTVG